MSKQPSYDGYVGPEDRFIDHIAISVILTPKNNYQEKMCVLDIHSKTLSSNLRKNATIIADALRRSRLAWLTGDVSCVNHDVRERIKIMGDIDTNHPVFHAPDNCEDCVRYIPVGEIDDKCHLFLHGWINNGRRYDIEMIPTGDGYLYPLDANDKRL